MKRLSGKTALITGGTSGIGLAATKLFLEEGARVVVVARGDEGLVAARKLGDNVQAIRADVTKTDELTKAFAEAKRTVGAIDVLLVNAALVQLSPIADTSEELFNKIVATNLKGSFDTLRLGIPGMRDGASVILMSSWLNRIGFAGSSVVSMTKAAMRSLARVAAAELAGRKIRVNALSPGAIETPMWGKLGLPQDVLASAGAAITAQIPLGRWGKPEEIARAALFLATDESSYLNGTELQVDGGMRQT